MPNRNYERGVRYERRTMKLLEDVGYTAVRTAGSHGPVDVIAWDWGSVRLIQVKAGRPPGPEEREVLARLPRPPGCIVECWVYRRARAAPEVFPVPREVA